jgi:hypothetical protein
MLDIMHNSLQQNQAFQNAWNDTNQRYINGTINAIRILWNQRHTSKHHRQALKSNVQFARKFKG